MLMLGQAESMLVQGMFSLFVRYFPFINII